MSGRANGGKRHAGYRRLRQTSVSAGRADYDKIRRRVVSGTQGTMVYWRMKAGAHAAAHKHPHEQFVWMVKGTMDFRIGKEKRTMKPGDVAVIPGEVEQMRDVRF